MPRASIYDLLYRMGAARWKRGWDAGVAPELRALVEEGTLTPAALGGARAVELGCGTGDNAIFLAETGFQTVGVDFSPAAVEQATAKAVAGSIENVRFVVADITKPLEGVDGPFDLIVLYNVLQDIVGDARQRAANVASALAREGSTIVVWCWYASRSRLPLISYRGPSRIAPFVLEPGEERRLFGDEFDYRRPAVQPPERRALFLLTKKTLRKDAAAAVDEGPEDLDGGRREDHHE